MNLFEKSDILNKMVFEEEEFMFFEISEREIFKCILLFKEKFSEDFNIVKKIKEMLDLVDFFIFKFLEFLGILKLNGGWFFGLYLVSFLIFLF